MAPPPNAPARLLEPQPLGPVEIRGWSFTHIVHEGRDVYHQPTVRPDRLQRALIAISRAHAHAPSVLGVPTPDAEYYLFPTQTDMRRGIPVLARVPTESAAVLANGLALLDADGIPVMVKLGRRELRVTRVVSTYSVHKLGEGFLGTGWKLQLEDYRRVVVFHSAGRGWLLVR